MSKGQSQREVVVAAFLILYVVVGSPFLHQVLIVTQLLSLASKDRVEQQPDA